MTDEPIKNPVQASSVAQRAFTIITMYFQGHTVDRISAELGIAPATVKKYLTSDAGKMALLNLRKKTTESVAIMRAQMTQIASNNLPILDQIIRGVDANGNPMADVTPALQAKTLLSVMDRVGLGAIQKSEVNVTTLTSEDLNSLFSAAGRKRDDSANEIDIELGDYSVLEEDES